MPLTRSPGAKAGAFERTTRPTPPERITSPIATAGMYVSISIHPRCVGSQDR
jgi:hypothetical protein